MAGVVPASAREVPMTGPARWLAAAVVALAAAPAAAREPADALPFPAKAPVVVHVHGVERTKARLAKTLAHLPKPLAAEAEAFVDQLLKAALAGRSLSAVPPDGHLFLVVHDLARLADEPHPVSVLVPVTGYRAFRESFLTADERKTFEAGSKGVDAARLCLPFAHDEPVYFVDLQGYVALTPDKATAEDYAAGKSPRARPADLGPDLAAAFLAADVSLYANMAVLTEAHRDDIKNYRELIEFSLKQAEMEEAAGGLDRRHLAAARVLVGTLLQGVEDSRGLVVAAEFLPDGLKLRAQARFAADTATARLLQAEEPTPLADLGRLPPGLGTYTATRFGPKTVGFARLVSGTDFRSVGDDALAAKVAKLEDELTAAGPGAEVTATGPKAHLSVTAFADARKAVAAETALYAALAPPSRIDSLVLREKPRVAPAARTHRGFECAEVRLAYDFEASVAQLPEVSRGATLALMRRNHLERPSLWIGTDGKQVVRVTAADWPAARHLLDAYLDGKPGLAADPGFQLTRRHLPADATAVAVYETGTVVSTALDLFRDIGKDLPGDLPDFADVKVPAGPPSYIGWALTLRPQSAAVDVFVPGPAINLAARTLAPLINP